MTGLGIPTEEQWEYACRGGTSTLFFFGDKLPDQPTLEKLLMARFEQLTPAAANPFGLYGMFVGEWCRNRFRPNYSPDAVTEDSYTVRGGGSVFWPWQDADEWKWWGKSWGQDTAMTLTVLQTTAPWVLTLADYFS